MPKTDAVDEGEPGKEEKDDPSSSGKKKKGRQGKKKTKKSKGGKGGKVQDNDTETAGGTEEKGDDSTGGAGAQLFGNAASAALKAASTGEAGDASEAGGTPAAAPAAAQLFGNVNKTVQPPGAKLPETMGQLLIASVVEQLFLDVFPVPLPSTDAVVRSKVKAFKKKRQRGAVGGFAGSSASKAAPSLSSMLGGEQEILAVARAASMAADKAAALAAITGAKVAASSDPLPTIPSAIECDADASAIAAQAGLTCTWASRRLNLVEKVRVQVACATIG